MKVLFFSFFTLLIALVCADTPGIRTVIISLATNESGEIIPYVLHKNSNGYDNPTEVPENSSSSLENANSAEEAEESKEEEEEEEEEPNDEPSSEEMPSMTSSSTHLDVSWYLVPPILISQLI